MRKRILSTILTAMFITTMFSSVNASAETVTAPSSHVQEKVIYHETFEETVADDTDFELNNPDDFAATYEDRGDGNGNALVYTAGSKVEDKSKSAWLRFLHNSAGDERKLTLHKYMEGADITEVSVDIYAPVGRNISFNVVTNSWQWIYCLDTSSNGYVFFPDWESSDNTRTMTENGATVDVQEISKANMKSWNPNYTADFTTDAWNTLKFVFNNKAGVVTTYVNDTIIGRRTMPTSKGKPGVIYIIDQSLAEAGEVMFKVDNLKITQKTLAPITTETWKEDFSTTSAFDATKHWRTGWGVLPTVVATGEEAYGNAMSVMYKEQGVGFLEKTNVLSNYMNADLSVIETDFKLPGKRRMAFDIVTTGWLHYSVIVSNNEWACFGGNLGDPLTAGNWGCDWTNGRTMKNMLDYGDSGNIAKGHIAGFPHDSELRWHNIRFVRDKVNKTLTAYLDGVSLGSVAFDAEPKSFRIISHNDGMTTGDTAMFIDNVKVGTIADTDTASLTLTKADGTEVENVVAGEVYCAKMTGIENDTAQAKGMQLIVAAYDVDRRMIDMNCYLYTIPAYTEISNGGEALSAVQLTAPASATTMKVFAWDGFDTIIPLCEAAVK
ncbi:MAG: hypothetical protein J6D26_00115 [Clostridia bacterium]|nr:hypothetical protein [Clostridia bacterium]